MAITVTQLNKYIKSLVETDINLNPVSIRGEISNFKLHSSGHCYLTLKDENCAVRAVMFKGYAQRLKFRPEDGMKIIASGKISVYERDGQYQLYISSMQPDGVGDLYKAYEQLKAKLQSEGLFDESHKKPIPKFPKTVGVITSQTGAAIRDIINVCKRRFKMAEILVCPVLVQGEGSASQIANAINYMNENNLADVLITGRGGGSIEDLWSFNEEIVAYSIYNSKIPVISAVGHETDFTIADFVADLRAPTPSAAAELAVPSEIELRANIVSLYERTLGSVKQNLNYKRKIVDSFSVKSPVDFINQQRLVCDSLMQKIINISQNAIRKGRQQNEKAYTDIFKITDKKLTEKSKALAVNAAKLDALSPLKVLSRGYGVIKGENGVIKSITDVKAGDTLTAQIRDGKFDCTVETICEEK